MENPYQPPDSRQHDLLIAPARATMPTGQLWLITIGTWGMLWSLPWLPGIVQLAGVGAGWLASVALFAVLALASLLGLVGVLRGNRRSFPHKLCIVATAMGAFMWIRVLWILMG